MSHEVSCHCGKLALTVNEAEIPAVIECNCSHCQRKGLLLWFVPATHVTFSNDEEAVGTYHFNRHAIDHRFCTTCGAQPYANGTDPKSGEPTVAVNVRCIPHLDLTTLTRIPYDGASA